MNSIDRRKLLFAIASGALAAASSPLGFALPVTRQLKGIFPIAFTPVGASGAIDYGGLKAQVQFCRRTAVHGLAWPQIASGWTTLTEAERMQGAEVLIDEARGGSTCIVIGVQSRTADFAETARYAKHAQRQGADAIICIAPSGVTAGADLLSYYQRLGEASSLPLFVQTGGDFSVDLLVELFNAVPTCRYVKDEAGDPLERVREIRQRTAGRLNCFSGKGVATLITEMERGFVGHCPFISFADFYASAYNAYHAGKMREAFEQFGRIQAAASMFAQSDINILIARGVLQPGTTARLAPALTTPAKHLAYTPDDIRRRLETYLKRPI